MGGVGSSLPEELEDIRPVGSHARTFSKKVRASQSPRMAWRATSERAKSPSEKLPRPFAQPTGACHPKSQLIGLRGLIGRATRPERQSDSLRIVSRWRKKCIENPMSDAGAEQVTGEVRPRKNNDLTAAVIRFSSVNPLFAVNSIASSTNPALMQTAGATRTATAVKRLIFLERLNINAMKAPQGTSMPAKNRSNTKSC